MSSRATTRRLATAALAAAQVGAPLARGVMATFSDDSAGPCSAAGYTATVDFGDGTPPTPGIVAFRFGGDFNMCSFGVSADHRYQRFGVFTTTVTVNGGALARSSSDSGEITVADVSLAGVGLPLTTGSGTFTGDVATFTDPNTFAPPTAFVSSIDWGDGVISTGTIGGGNGAFTVNGSHTYQTGGTFPVRVTFGPEGAPPAVALTSIVVPNLAAPAPGPVLPTAIFRAKTRTIRLSTLRRRGLKLVIRTGNRNVRRLSLTVLNTANRRVGTSTIRLHKSSLTQTITWKPSKSLLRKLRAGRTYGLRVRLPGGPTLQTTIRISSRR
jgi:hypothetical protein